jgi:hypothetical protein
MLFSPEAVCWLEEMAISARNQCRQSAAAAPEPHPIMMYWREAGLAGAFLRLRGRRSTGCSSSISSSSIQFFFNSSSSRSRRAYRRASDGVVCIKINIVKIDLRLVITFGRLTRTTSTTIAGIGFQLVFWFEFIHLTPHSKAYAHDYCISPEMITPRDAADLLIVTPADNQQ